MRQLPRSGIQIFLLHRHLHQASITAVFRAGTLVLRIELLFLSARVEVVFEAAGRSAVSPRVYVDRVIT